MNVSVIVSTFRQPAWLEKVLWGYFAQRRASFEIVIAEDDRDPATEEVVQRMRRQNSPAVQNLVHVRHTHQGYRKCVILNRAVLAASGEYLIFTDGDCIPHPDFVATHVRLARQGRFLSGGSFRLTRPVSEALTLEMVTSGRCFQPRCLRELGQPWSRWMLRLKLVGTSAAAVLDYLTPTRPTWNGGNASTFKEYVLAINGFDHRMQYGGQDREFGERLVNMGLRGVQVRHRAVCLHLDHERSYARPEGVTLNRELRRQTRRQRLVRTAFGIDQLDHQPL